MRTETDEFHCQELIDDSISANAEGEYVSFDIESLNDVGVALLTKQQAAEFARQLLEMVGEEGNEND